jgi:hypothetical protein
VELAVRVRPRRSWCKHFIYSSSSIGSHCWESALGSGLASEQAKWPKTFLLPLTPTCVISSPHGDEAAANDAFAGELGDKWPKGGRGGLGGFAARSAAPASRDTAVKRIARGRIPRRATRKRTPGSEVNRTNQIVTFGGGLNIRRGGGMGIFRMISALLVVVILGLSPLHSSNTEKFGSFEIHVADLGNPFRAVFTRGMAKRGGMPSGRNSCSGASLPTTLAVSTVWAGTLWAGEAA